MNSTIILNEVQLNRISKLASKEKRALGYADDTPLARDIFSVLERLDIILLEFPFTSTKDATPFSAAIMSPMEDDGTPVFIGLNTADYFDKQVFAIAHELYHFYTKTGSHLSRLDGENELIEAKANRFAVEFLLPDRALKSIILSEFSSSCS